MHVTLLSQAPAEAAAAYQKLLEDRKAAAEATAAEAAAGGGGAAPGAAASSGLPPGVKVCEAFELAQPGEKDGQTKIVHEGDGSIAAYSWDAGKCVWEKIGTVVEAPEPGELRGFRGMVVYNLKLLRCILLS